MASWTKPKDVIDAWIGEDAPTDVAKVQLWIDRAEREVRHQVPGIQSRITAELPATDLQMDAVDVVVSMVTRIFRNPLGARQQQSTTGPYSDSLTFGGENPGELYLTPAELGKLQGGGSGRAFTVTTIPTTSPYYVEPA